jgi:hypothetical protein
VQLLHHRCISDQSDDSETFVNDLGRRYFLFTGTKAGKQLLVQLMITVGVVLNLVSTLLENNPHADGRLLHALTGLGLGFVLVGVAFMFANRKAAG